jgi:hypothetical protein
MVIGWEVVDWIHLAQGGELTSGLHEMLAEEVMASELVGYGTNKNAGATMWP